MEMDKAIEILTQHQKGTDMPYLPDFPDAEKLGIEAMKRLTQNRKCEPQLQPSLLPGETPPDPLYALGFNTGDDESP